MSLDNTQIYESKRNGFVFECVSPGLTNGISTTYKERHTLWAPRSKGSTPVRWLSCTPRAVFLSLLLLSVSVHAQPENGDQLNKASNLTGALLGGLFSVISDTKLEGRITSVTIDRIVENELSLDLAFEGFSHSTIKAYVADHEGKRIRSVSESKLKVTTGEQASSVAFTLSLNESVNINEALQTDLVVFSISKPNSPSVPLRIVSFHLDKNWSHKVSAENVVVAVRPTPIGRTAQKVSDVKRGIQTRVSAVMQRGAVRMEQVEQVRRRFKTTGLKSNNLRVLDSKNADLLKTLNEKKQKTSATVNARSSRINTSTITKLKKGTNNTFDLSKLVKIDPAKFVYVKPQESATSTEPTNQVTRNAVRWYDVITESGVSVDLRDELGIYNIYQDSNANSGVYYFVPKNYGLTYSSDYPGAEGLGLRISYDRNASDQPVEDSSIRVAMTLGSGLDNNGVELATRILQRLDTRDPGFKFRNLQPLPTGGPVSFDFSTGLFNIVDPESISVLSYSDVLEEISVSFASDELEAERIRTSLEDPALGIPGEVIFPLPSLDGEATAEIIPARVNLAEPKAYKALQWSDNGDVRNKSPLPIRVSKLHMLDIDYGLGSIVYSWNLGNVGLPAWSKLELDMQDLPQGLISQAEHIWFEYDFDPACGNCLSEVVDDVVIANVMKERTDLSIKFIAPFTCHDAFALKLDIRSHFFDPTDRELSNGESQYFEATQDLSGFINMGSVFLDDADTNDEDQDLPHFEYRLSEVLNSGEVRESARWLPYSGQVLFLGASQIGQSFPDLPCLGVDPVEPISPVTSDDHEDLGR